MVFTLGSILVGYEKYWASQMSLAVKNPPANAGDIRDIVSIPGSRRSPGAGRGNPLQYSYLENPMDRGAWRSTVHGIAMSQTRLSDKHFHLEVKEFQRLSETTRS